MTNLDTTNSRDLNVVPLSVAAPTKDRKYWLDAGLERAGVELSAWDIDRDIDDLDELVFAIYRYYGDIFLADNDLLWSGMANAIGPTFAAGIVDLCVYDQTTALATNILIKIFEHLGLNEHHIPLRPLDHKDMDRFVRLLLRMQKAIFLDTAPVHEAYLAGGISAIDDLNSRGQLSTDMYAAWTEIERGKALGSLRLVREGNRALLYREQAIVVDPYYRRMFSSPGGAAFTYLLTAVGQPSIRGAQAFGERYPLRLALVSYGKPWLNVPRLSRLPMLDDPSQAAFVVNTALPDGNVAKLADRWALIEESTLPAYLDLGYLERRWLAGSPVAHRVKAQRACLLEAAYRLLKVGGRFVEKLD